MELKESSLPFYPAEVRATLNNLIHLSFSTNPPSNGPGPHVPLITC